MDNLDISANRKVQKYKKKEQLRRVIWSVCSVLFRCSPRTAFGWRSALLRLMGAEVGENVHIYRTAEICMPWNLEVGTESAIGEHAFIYNLGRITIGKRATISQRAHLCAGTHEYDVITLPLLKPPIVIKDDVWICADAFVGPGVMVEEGAIVGARAVVMKDVGAWSIVVGNPARVIKQRVLKSGRR